MTQGREAGAATSEGACIRTSTDATVAIDVAAIAVGSVAICVAADRLLFMTLLIPILVTLRFLAWSRLPLHRRWASAQAEIAFFVVCTLIGAVNDWSSVVRHRIYDYDVPAAFPTVTTIPFWMLLYWGMILRATATVCRWHRLGPPKKPRNDVHFGHIAVESAALKLSVIALLVVVTRQLIYRFFDDPVWSWLPFAGALLVYVVTLRPRRHGVALGVLALVGCAVEATYTQVGRLHHYQLGWFAGVPLWIVLWWVLAVWIWDDLSVRLQTAIDHRRSKFAESTLHV